MQISAKDLAQLVGGDVVGNEDVMVSQPAKIEEGGPETLSFLANPKYEDHLYEGKTTVVLIKRDQELRQETASTLIKVDDPYATFTFLLKKFADVMLDYKGVSELAYVDPTATLGDDVYVGAFAYIAKNVSIGKGSKVFPNCFVGDNSRVGNDCTIFSGVNIYHYSMLGNRVIIHSGATIGSDGFGFAPKPDGSYDKIPQIGNVIIEDNVEIGGNVVIDRATMGSTIIKQGAKIDNLVQIAHNAEVGEHTAIAAQVGVSGSTKLGKHMIVGGQAGFVGHISIADGTKVNAQSGVTKSITEEGQAISGGPAFDWRKELRSQAIFRNLPELEQRIAALERQIEQLTRT